MPCKEAERSEAASDLREWTQRGLYQAIPATTGEWNRKPAENQLPARDARLPGADPIS